MKSPSSLTVGEEAATFDRRSGSLVERALFNHRLAVLLVCAVITLLLGLQASHLRLNASFEKTIPQGHPYIANWLAHQADLKGLGNAVRIAVANPKGDIYDAAYLDALRDLNDKIFLIPGVDRSAMKSLWTPNMRWTGVTEEGLEGGPVIPDGYDGRAERLQQLRTNVQRSGEIGQIVALDGRSSVIFVPLLARDAQGHALDYVALSDRLEALRAEFQAKGVDIHITASRRSSAT
jgi:predicted RND superfamily exporter protein